MNRNRSSFGGLLLLVFLLSALSSAPSACADAKYLSPISLAASRNGGHLYIAEKTAQQMAVFNVATGKVAVTASLPESPTGLVLGSRGQRLFITGGSAAGDVYVFDMKRRKVTATIPVGHTPMAPTLSPDGKTLYVCNRFDADVSVIDVVTGKETTRIDVVREPVAAAITSDGRYLYVANNLPTGPANGSYTAAAVSVIDTKTRECVKKVPFLNGSVGLRGVCVSPDGKYVYVTHILARYHLPTTQLERGWMNTNAITIIDAASHELVNTVLLDDVDLGAANPWGIACTGNGRQLCVALAGTHELSVIDRQGLHAKLDEYEAKGESDAVPNSLSFLVGLRRRIAIDGNGPRALVLLRDVAYVTEYFSDSLAVVDINSDKADCARSVALGPEQSMTDVRRGEMLFHDGQYCFQKWQSCSSCHPGDGRPDALNWDLMNDDLGNPKNTKSLLLSHKTPPAMSLGVRENAEAAVRAGIRHIQFSVRPEEEAEAIDEYLKSLKPERSPYLVDGELSDAAKRGKEVFGKAGCGKCHPAPLYTDLKMYDMDTGRGLDKGKKFDTPTLVEVWRTAPYLYDGRAATLEDLFAIERHGDADTLNKDEMSDLIEFTNSL